MSQAAGTPELPTFTVKTVPKAPLTIMRFTYEKTRNDVIVSGKGNDDALLLSLSLKDHPAFDHWCEGRFLRGTPGRAGYSSLVDLKLRHATRLDFSIDALQLYFPRAVLDALTDDEGGPRFPSLRTEPGRSRDDAVVRSLGALLLPALSRPAEVNRLFIEHVASALLAHLGQTYGAVQAAPQRPRGGLAPRQERRAKEVLIAHLDGDVTIERLARECGLSRSHFARAFRETTGQPPHRWLLARRIERAEQLLSNPERSLAEIASLCGFADQSHFTRAFRDARGISPGAWRRRE